MPEKIHRTNINIKKQGFVQENQGFFKKYYIFVRNLTRTLFFDSEIVGPICVLLFFCEAILLELIIMKIPYTEIDYKTYMQQITQIEQGELNYDKISGDTGPIVYPGGYVFLYSWMKMLTNGIEYLKNGQQFFRLLYLMTLALTFLIYLQMNGRNRVKPIVFYFLVISKRLHSIYVLRLFNDCFTTFFMLGTILLLQLAANFKKGSYENENKTERRYMGLYANLLTFLAVDCYMLGLSVKMNALLYLPGLLIIVYFLNDENLLKTLGMLVFGVFIFIGVNFQFLCNGEEIRNSFLKNAFDFKRQFMYKWSVNWKFVDEEVFLSEMFHKFLLALHIITLLTFIFAKWLTFKMTGKSLYQLLVNDGLLRFYQNTLNQGNCVIFTDESGYNIAKIMMLSNITGVLFARSLHYQFLSWYYYSLPFLVFDSVANIYVGVVLLLLHEWAWNVYPSTSVSSFIGVSVLLVVLGAQLFFHKSVYSIKRL
jgi:alpha-1,3-mannosyltransferase